MLPTLSCPAKVKLPKPVPMELLRAREPDQLVPLPLSVTVMGGPPGGENASAGVVAFFCGSERVRLTKTLVGLRVCTGPPGTVEIMAGGWDGIINHVGALSASAK